MRLAFGRAVMMGALAAGCGAEQSAAPVTPPAASRTVEAEPTARCAASVSACAGSSALPSAAVAPSSSHPSPSATPDLASSGTPGWSAAPGPGVLEPLPTAPPKGKEKQLEVLSSICAVAAYRSERFTQWGCRFAPPFEEPGAQPDGQVLVEENPYVICGLEAFYPGSFTSAGKDQVVLGFQACGADRLNDISPGTAVLVERQAGRWRLLEVEPGTNVAGCKPSRRRDRTLLVCSDNMGAFGDGAIAWRFTLDFAKPAGTRVDVFSKIYSGAGLSCFGGAELMMERGLTDVREINERFADVDGDGDEDLRVTIERAHEPGSERSVRRLGELCQSSGGITQMDRELLTHYQRFVLEYRGEATTLVPTAATAKLLEEWGKMAPEFWWNLR